MGANLDRYIFFNPFMHWEVFLRTCVHDIFSPYNLLLFGSLNVCLFFFVAVVHKFLFRTRMLAESLFSKSSILSRTSQFPFPPPPH